MATIINNDNLRELVNSYILDKSRKIILGIYIYEFLI